MDYYAALASSLCCLQCTLFNIHYIYIIHQTICLNIHVSRDWMSQLKLGINRVTFSNFQNCICYKKYLKDNKHKSLHLDWMYAQIFVLVLKAQFSSRYNFGKQSTSHNRKLCPHTNIWKYFYAKWKLLFRIYYFHLWLTEGND